MMGLCHCRACTLVVHADFKFRFKVQNSPVVQAKVTVAVHWDQVFFWILQVLSMVLYLGTRLWYLVSGESVRLSNGDISVTYSWMVLVADIGLSFMGLYLQQKFWKQTVEFRPLTDLDILKITKVRCAVLCGASL